MRAGYGFCRVCGHTARLTVMGLLYAHGPKGNRCDGGRKPPRDSAEQFGRAVAAAIGALRVHVINGQPAVLLTDLGVSINQHLHAQGLPPLEISDG